MNGTDPASPTEKLSTVLVATDFSAPATAALEHAAALASEHGAHLRLVHAIEWLESWWSPMKLQTDYVEKLRDEGRERLRAALESCAVSPSDVSYEIDFGPAYEVILRLAEQHGPDLVVLATRGQHGARRVVLGSTAVRVILNAATPVLTLNATEAHPPRAPRRIVVPVDLALDYQAPLRAALRLTAATDAVPQIVLVHAVDLPHRYRVHVESWDDFAAGATETIREHIEEAAEELREDGHEVETVVDVGDPAKYILEAASDPRADLIALQTRGGVPRPRLHFGSVAKRIVRSAPCPVLTVAPVISDEDDRDAD